MLNAKSTTVFETCITHSISFGIGWVACNWWHSTHSTPKTCMDKAVQSENMKTQNEGADSTEDVSTFNIVPSLDYNTLSSVSNNTIDNKISWWGRGANRNDC